MKKGSTFGNLDFKIAMIRAAAMKSEIEAQRRTLKAQKKATTPSKAVTYKHA